MNVAVACLAAYFVLTTGRVIQDAQEISLSNNTGLVAPNQSNGVGEKRIISKRSTRVAIKPGVGSLPRKYKIVIKKRRHRTHPQEEVTPATIDDSEVASNDSTESYAYEIDKKTKGEVSGIAEWLNDPDPDKVPQIISDSEISNATFFQKVIVDLCKSLNKMSDFWTVVTSKFGLDLPETKLLYRYLHYIVEMSKNLGIDNLPLVKILVEIMEHTPISIHDTPNIMSSYEEPVEKNNTNMKIYHIYEVNTANNEGESFLPKGTDKYPDISGYAEHLEAGSDEITNQPSRRGESLTLPHEIYKQVPEQMSLYDTNEFLKPPEVLKSQATLTNENETRALKNISNTSEEPSKDIIKIKLHNFINPSHLEPLSLGEWSLKNINSTQNKQQNFSTTPTINTDDSITTIEHNESVESLQSRLIPDKNEDYQSLVVPEIIDEVLEELFFDPDKITTTLPARSDNDTHVPIFIKEKAKKLDVPKNKIENLTTSNNETAKPVFAKPDDLKENITLLWDERNPKTIKNFKPSIIPLTEAFSPNPDKYQVMESQRLSNATEYNTDIPEFQESIKAIPKKLPPHTIILQLSDGDLDVHELASLENSLEYDKTGIPLSEEPNKKDAAKLKNNSVAPVILLKTDKLDHTEIKPQLEIIDKDLEVESEEDLKKTEKDTTVAFPLKVMTEEPDNLKSKLDVLISPELDDQNKTIYEDSKSLLLNDDYTDVDTLLEILDDSIYRKPDLLFTEEAILQSPLEEKSTKDPKKSELNSGTSIVEDTMLKEPEQYEKMKLRSLIYKKVDKTVPLHEKPIQNESELTYNKKDDNISVIPNVEISNENYPIGLKPDREFTENPNLLHKPDDENNKLLTPAFTGLGNAAPQFYGFQNTWPAPLSAGSGNAPMPSEQNNEKTTEYEDTNPYHFSTKYETGAPLSIGAFLQAPSELLGMSNLLKQNKEKVDYLNDKTDDKDTGKYTDDKLVLPLPTRRFETSNKLGTIYDKNIMSVIPNSLYTNRDYSNGFYDHNPDISEEQLDVMPIFFKKPGDYVLQKHTSTFPALPQSQDVNDDIYKPQKYSSKPLLFKSFMKEPDVPTSDLQERFIQQPGYEKMQSNELPTVEQVYKLQKLNDNETKLPQLIDLGSLEDNIDSTPVPLKIIPKDLLETLKTKYPNQRDEYDDIPALFENSIRNDGQFNLVKFPDPDYRDVVIQEQPVKFTDPIILFPNKYDYPEKFKNPAATESDTKYDVNNVFPSIPYSLKYIAETKSPLTKVNSSISSHEDDNVKYPKAFESDTKYRRTGDGMIYPYKELSEVPPSNKKSYDYTLNPSRIYYPPNPVYMIPRLVKFDQNPLQMVPNELDPIYFNYYYFLSNPNFHNFKEQNWKDPWNNLNRPLFDQGNKYKKDDDTTLDQNPKDKILLSKLIPNNKESIQDLFPLPHFKEQPKILDTSDILIPPMEANQIDESYKNVLREKPSKNLNDPFLHQGYKYKKDDDLILNQDPKDKILITKLTPIDKESILDLFSLPHFNEQPKMLNDRSDILTPPIEANQIDESYKNLPREKPWNKLNGPFLHKGYKYKKVDDPTLNQDPKDKILISKLTAIDKESIQDLFPLPHFNEQPKMLNDRSDILTPPPMEANQNDESFNAPYKNVLREKPIDAVKNSWKTPTGVSRTSTYPGPVAEPVTQEKPIRNIPDFNVPYSFVKKLITQLIEYFRIEIRKKCNQEAGK